MTDKGGDDVASVRAGALDADGLKRESSDRVVGMGGLVMGSGGVGGYYGAMLALQGREGSVE